MRLIAIIFGLAVLPLAAAAQTNAPIGNPAGLAPDTRMESPGVPAPNQTNYQDRLFAQLLTAGGMAEVELGRLAADRAAGDDVRQFARRMMNDHGPANEKLKSVADKSKVPLPKQLDPDHRKKLEDLGKLEGAEFDLAYIAAQIVDHQKTAQLLAWEIGQGEDAEIQRFAADTLPTVLDHLRAAREIQSKLAGQATAANQP